MTRRWRIGLGAVLMVLVLGPAGAAADPASRNVSQDKLLQSEAQSLVIWTLMAIDQARKTGNTSVLRRLGTAAYRKRVPPGALRKMLAALKAEDYSGLHGHVVRFPKRFWFSRLQKAPGEALLVDACYCPEGYHLYFRMRYRKTGKFWRIDAMRVWDVVD